MSLVNECPASTPSQHLGDSVIVTLDAKEMRKMRDSNPPVPTTPPKSKPGFQLPSTRYNPHLAQRMLRSICFHCRKIGHWAVDCPLKPKSRGLMAENSNFPKIYCRCGHGLCEVKKVLSGPNYGRFYYICRIERGTYFVKWCDAVNESDLLPPLHKHPSCSCGAGVRRKEKETSGPNEGRYFFACPIGADHGACNYHQWEEDALLAHPNVAITRQGCQRTLHDYWGKEGNQVDEDNINDSGKDSDPKRMRTTGDSEHFSAAVVSERLEGQDIAPKETSADRSDHAELPSPPHHVDFPELEAAENLKDIDMMNSASSEAIQENARSIIRLSTPSGIHSRQRESQKQLSTVFGW